MPMVSRRVQDKLSGQVGTALILEGEDFSEPMVEVDWDELNKLKGCVERDTLEVID